MSKPKKPPLVKLGEMKPGQLADCFAQLADKTRGQTRDGKPFYSCRFRDPRRTAGAKKSPAVRAVRRTRRWAAAGAGSRPRSTGPSAARGWRSGCT